MPKIEIDVDQILTCAIHLEASPGDQLLVMQGVVVAMVEGRKPSNRTPACATAAAVPEPPVAPADPNAPALTRTTMMDVLREHGPMTTRQVADHLSRTHRYIFNETERNKIGSLMRDLFAKRMTQANTEGSKRFPTYNVF